MICFTHNLRCSVLIEQQKIGRTICSTIIAVGLEVLFVKCEVVDSSSKSVSVEGGLHYHCFNV